MKNYNKIRFFNYVRQSKELLDNEDFRSVQKWTKKQYINKVDFKKLDIINNLLEFIKKEFDIVRCSDCYDLDHYNEDQYINTHFEFKCPKCYENYTTCSYCEQYFLNDDLEYIENDFFCASCLEAYTFKCEICGIHFKNIDGITTHYNTKICPRCYRDNNFSICEQCGDAFICEDLSYSEEEDGYYCRDCYPEDANIEQYGKTHASGYLSYNNGKLSNKFLSNKIYLACEQEIEFKGVNKYDAIQVLKNFEFPEELHKFKIFTAGDFYAFKSDSSLYDGVELAPKYPATLEFYQKFKDTFKNFSLLMKDKDFYIQKSCGGHININRKPLEYNKRLIKNLFKTLGNPELEIFISKIADRDLSTYCEFKKYSEKEINSIAEGLNSINKHVHINAQNEVIEFRAFKGVRDYVLLYKNLQFVDLLIKFIRKFGFIADDDEFITKFSRFVLKNKKNIELIKWYKDNIIPFYFNEDNEDKLFN